MRGRVPGGQDQAQKALSLGLWGKGASQPQELLKATHVRTTGWGNNLKQAASITHKQKPQEAYTSGAPRRKQGWAKGQRQGGDEAVIRVERKSSERRK